MKDKSKGEGEETLETLHFFAFLDKKGRIIIPTRNRKEAGLMDIAADVECQMTVLKTYSEREGNMRNLNPEKVEKFDETPSYAVGSKKQ